MNSSTKTDGTSIHHEVIGIFRYPVKSMGGESLTTTEIGPAGIPYDRNWMLIDENGRFLTQRDMPELCLFSASVRDGILHLIHRPSGEHIEIDETIMGRSTLVPVSIWQRHHTAVALDHPVNEWLSEKLERKVTLTKVADPFGYSRTVPGTRDFRIAFPDGYPLLLLGTASLQELNTRLKEGVNADRFRTNILISTKIPHEEDQYGQLIARDGKLELIKPCPRCMVTTIDQTAGTSGPEPLKTLGTYRKQGNQVYFGMYSTARKTLHISTGDRIRLK